MQFAMVRRILDRVHLEKKKQIRWVRSFQLGERWELGLRSAVHPPSETTAPPLKIIFLPPSPSPHPTLPPLFKPFAISNPPKPAQHMGFSDTITGLVDRLKPTNKPTSFSGIGSGNQGARSFEDDVSSLPLVSKQPICHLPTIAPRLTILYRR